jgi:hypothetical protein
MLPFHVGNAGSVRIVMPRTSLTASQSLLDVVALIAGAQMSASERDAAMRTGDHERR